MQWTLLVPFLGLSLFILTVIPDPTPPDPAVVGCWSSTQEDEWAGKPLVDLDLGADGDFEMRVFRRDPTGGPRTLHGRYEIVYGSLLLTVDGRSMIWGIRRRAAQLAHKTKAGLDLRLERRVAGERLQPASLLQVSQAAN